MSLAPTMRSEKLAIGLANEPYSSEVEVEGGSAPLRFSIVAGALPQGLELDANTGLLSGTPRRPGEFEFSVAVRDRYGRQAIQKYSLLIDRSLGRAGSAPGQPVKAKPDSLGALSAPQTAPDVSNLLSMVAGMGEGQWQRVNLNNFSDVWTPADLRPLKGLSNPTPGAIILAWSGFAWDSNRGNLLIYGGGHANYRGNDTYLWRGSTQMWERASLPSEMVQTPLGYWNAIDGWDKAPASAHTYDNNIFLPLLDRMLVLGGAADPNGGHYYMQPTPTTKRITGPYLFDPSRAHPDQVGGTTGSHVQRVAPYPQVVGGNMWQNRESWLHASATSKPPTNVNSDGCTGYEQASGRDVIYLKNKARVYRYEIFDISNPAADVWTEVGRYYYAGSGGQSACAYDPVRKLLVTTQSQTVPFVFWNMATAGAANRDVLVNPADPTGEFAAMLATTAMKDCGFDFDPQRNDFKLWCGGGSVWTLTPPPTASATGWTVTKAPPPTSAVPTESVGTGIIGKWKYIPNLDVFIGLLDAIQGNIWIYKPVGWVNPTGGNLPPTVALTTPVSGATFVPGSTVAVTASAADADGTVAKVEFYVDGAKISEHTDPPYAVNWLAASAGTYALTAVATDDAAAMTTSATVTVTVAAPNVPPTVNLAAPSPGATFPFGTNIDIAANASDSDGTVVLVEFFANGSKIGERTAAPYALAWSGAPAGTHALTAVARDNRAATGTSAAVSIVVVAPANAPPTVSLSSPAANSSHPLGTGITVAAIPSDTDGSISKVEFFANGAKIGERSVAPYSVTWSPIAVGDYLLSATATDNAGAIGTSSTTAVTVVASTNAPPTVSIVQPAPASSWPADMPLTIEATASDGDGSVVLVEFFAGSTKLGEATTAPFSMSWAAPPAGAHTLVAVATDNGGAATTSAAIAITVVSAGSTTLTLQRGSIPSALAFDAYLSTFHKSMNFGRSAVSKDQNQSYATLLRFAIFQSEGGPVPNGATVTSAVLSLYKTTPYEMSYGLHRVLVDWSETGANWNNRIAGTAWAQPGANGLGADIASTPDATASIGWSPGWLSLDVTAAVQQMASSPNFGWRLRGTGGYVSGLKYFSMSESVTVTERPKLLITFSGP